MWVWDHTQDSCSTSLTSSPQVLLCHSSQEKLAMQRHLPWKAQEDERVAESLAEQTCGSWDADGVMLPARPGACCTIPACTPFYLLGKGAPNEEHQNDAFLVKDSRWGFLSTFFNSLLTFLTLTMCTAWGAFGTQRESLVWDYLLCPEMSLFTSWQQLILHCSPGTEDTWVIE